MLRASIYAIGALKSGPEHALCELYLKRLGASVRVSEYEARDKNPQVKQAKESDFILNALKPSEALIALDETGKSLSTLDLNALLLRLRDQGKHPAFAIGGADGHTQELKQRANYKLSFGQLTWPHKLVRVMLLEQLYRCQQIEAGHPYHRG